MSQLRKEKPETKTTLKGPSSWKRFSQGNHTYRDFPKNFPKFRHRKPIFWYFAGILKIFYSLKRPLSSLSTSKTQIYVPFPETDDSTHLYGKTGYTKNLRGTKEILNTMGKNIKIPLDEGEEIVTYRLITSLRTGVVKWLTRHETVAIAKATLYVQTKVKFESQLKLPYAPNRSNVVMP